MRDGEHSLLQLLATQACDAFSEQWNEAMCACAHVRVCVSSCVCVDNEISVVDNEFKLYKSTTGMDSRENIWDGFIDLGGGSL